MNVALRSNEGDIVDLEVAGRFDQHRMALGPDPIIEVAGKDVYSRKVLIDMSRVPMLDSSGVGWFLNRHKLCQQAGGQLVLHSLSTMTQNVFKVLNMQMVLTIASNRKEAVRIAQSA